MEACLMAIGAHADDIELGVGGTLLKYRGGGCRVAYVMATNNMAGGHKALANDGTRQVTHVSPRRSMAVRKRECAAAAARLGTEPVHLDHPQRHYHTGRGGPPVELRYGGAAPAGVPADRPTILTAHSDPASVARLAELMLASQAACVFTHGPVQQNIEHSATCLLVTRSYWQAVEQGHRGALLYWIERWAAPHTYCGDFYARWETHSDISAVLEAKIELIGLHRSQMPEAQRPEFFMRRRARDWGRACGCGAAEVFTVAHAGHPRRDRAAAAVSDEFKRNRKSPATTAGERALLATVAAEQTLANP